MGKVDTETEKYSVNHVTYHDRNQQLNNSLRELFKKISKVEGVNTIKHLCMVDEKSFQSRIYLIINEVNTNIFLSQELIQDCLPSNGLIEFEEISNLIIKDVKEFIKTGNPIIHKPITSKAEEIDGKLVLNFYYEDGTPLIAKQN